MCVCVHKQHACVCCDCGAAPRRSEVGSPTASRRCELHCRPFHYGLTHHTATQECRVAETFFLSSSMLPAPSQFIFCSLFMDYSWNGNNTLLLLCFYNSLGSGARLPCGRVRFQTTRKKKLKKESKKLRPIPFVRLETPSNMTPQQSSTQCSPSSFHSLLGSLRVLLLPACCLLSRCPQNIPQLLGSVAVHVVHVPLG